MYCEWRRNTREVNIKKAVKLFQEQLMHIVKVSVLLMWVYPVHTFATRWSVEGVIIIGNNIIATCKRTRWNNNRQGPFTIPFEPNAPGPKLPKYIK